MRMKRHIITAAVAVSCVFGAPQSASAGGIDPTRWCIQDAVSAYLYYPYSVTKATEFAARVKRCGQYFGMHMTDSDKRVAWERCIENGLERSVPPLTWDPLLAALTDCTATWLEFSVQVDPYP